MALGEMMKGKSKKDELRRWLDFRAIRNTVATLTAQMRRKLCAQGPLIRRLGLDEGAQDVILGLVSLVSVSVRIWT
jgi:hypothetical protein